MLVEWLGVLRPTLTFPLLMLDKLVQDGCVMQRLVRLLITKTLEQTQGYFLKCERLHYDASSVVPVVCLLADQKDDVFVAFLDLLPRTPADLVVTI